MQKQILWTGIFFMLPISMILFIFLFLPILQSLYYSLTNWTGVGDYSFIGFANYQSIFTDSIFMDTLKRTLFIGLTTALFTNLAGLFIAVLLDQSLFTKNILRVLFYLPNVIPFVVAAFVWRYMLDANDGLLNRTLSMLLSKNIHIPWVDSPSYVIWSIIVISVWQMMGPVIIVYIAALQGVPEHLKEAALIEGASPVKSFFSVTLPMIAPGITVSVLIGLSNGIRIFDLPFALTGGGPANSSETLSIRIYRYAFQSSDLGYAMSASFILTLLVILITFFFVAMSRRYEVGAEGA
ncbi:carbohydrate ABC transporter permease [Paenibacillus monticola]|uniref:ABC transporter permease subunit n=1 Tax=Paenibacillus monticola TaxID=2666075 RepID=A0A7X2H363_9BACL|nr:sugar ABC transporter permease [Paenibacillus monticola]MRN52646.1 ABC transporter permease subunit [Paenibacillus monticola]